jgi:hypothetical protein
VVVVVEGVEVEVEVVVVGVVMVVVVAVVVMVNVEGGETDEVTAALSNLEGSRDPGQSVDAEKLEQLVCDCTNDTVVVGVESFMTTPPDAANMRLRSPLEVHSDKAAVD